MKNAASNIRATNAKNLRRNDKWEKKILKEVFQSQIETIINKQP